MTVSGVTNVNGWVMGLRAVGGGGSIGNSGYVECNKSK